MQGHSVLFGLEPLICGAMAATAVLAITQGIILHKFIRGMFTWLSVSIAGAGVGVVMGILTGGVVFLGISLVYSAVHDTLRELFFSDNEAWYRTDDLNWFVYFLINSAYAIGGAIGGAFVAHFQRSCFLQSCQPGRSWNRGWAAGAACANFAIGLPDLRFGLQGGLSGLVFGLVTGPMLIMMLQGKVEVSS
jgi:hypothetical protein